MVTLVRITSQRLSGQTEVIPNSSETVFGFLFGVQSGFSLVDAVQSALWRLSIMDLNLRLMNFQDLYIGNVCAFVDCFRSVSNALVRR